MLESTESATMSLSCGQWQKKIIIIKQFHAGITKNFQEIGFISMSDTRYMIYDTKTFLTKKLLPFFEILATNLW